MLALVECISACGNKEDAKSFAENISCPPPAVAQIEPWGKSGAQEICKIKHGPFVAWEAGYVHLRGSYTNGEKTGVWRWYDRSGNVVEEIDYDKKPKE